MIDNPTVFISYSHSSEAHKTWVLELACMLMHDGVEVIIDRWYLSVGDDVIHFMEKNCSDLSISKILAICDKEYQQKANMRTRGSGVEAQILSSEIYARLVNSRVIPIVVEMTEDGKPCLPVFLRNRYFIDFSNPQNISKNYSVLVSTIFDVPVDQKPPRASIPPDYVIKKSITSEPNGSSLSQPTLYGDKTYPRYSQNGECPRCGSSNVSGVNIGHSILAECVCHECSYRFSSRNINRW